LLNAIPAVLRELRLAGVALLEHFGKKPTPGPYETLWLELTLDLTDAHGERAILTRRQTVRFHGLNSALVRELVWGEGDQLVRYTAVGARRLAVRAEGSKRAVLLSPDGRPRPGDRLTITSRRTIRGGFRGAEEYCEAMLERPTKRLRFTVVFPLGRPPKTSRLVLATTETMVRQFRPRYRADGRAVVHCQVQDPMPATVYSVRWSW
jgi:hypothetical protein